jgi:hypothetical protein
MKKFLLGTVALVALGIAAPASAADLAARPYQAPPPYVASIYDWTASTSAPTAAMAGPGSVLILPGLGSLTYSLKAAVIRAVALPAARSATAGKRAPGCLDWKLRATGLISGPSVFL